MRVLVLVLAACSSRLPPDHPCSEENPRAHAFVRACELRVLAECNPDPAVPCEVERECEEAWARRCEQ